MPSTHQDTAAEVLLLHNKQEHKQHGKRFYLNPRRFHRECILLQRHLLGGEEGLQLRGVLRLVPRHKPPRRRKCSRNRHSAHTQPKHRAGRL